ncbi:hypothetical protein [Helicobacter ailurogastricus]|uniref:Uncharacterized protein n=1 Tax=Helicobacter ailurogastricus TaxID=1578720 RepID=A0A0K2XZ56_9HELI|nr:hypothetical protein [Helicobacter ailurogastricus]BDQ29057.1 hypothetical protein ASB7_08940 [Helicobacter ailurogastricus]CRF51948.1 FIG00711868: hypothetical protein [Helicobacter ailurogastricus]
MDLNTLSEETLKHAIKERYFKNFTFKAEKIDFQVCAPKEQLPRPLLWAEAKAGSCDAKKALTQLVLTILKNPKGQLPPFLGAFDALRFSVVETKELEPLLNELAAKNYKSAPSDTHSTEFKEVEALLSPLLDRHLTSFAYATQEEALKNFIQSLHTIAKTQTPIDENNFVHAYHAWLEHVKPTIQIDWQKAQAADILDADFYLADLLSENDHTIFKELNTRLKGDHYEFDKEIDDLGLFNSKSAVFKDKQQTHKAFWRAYKRPPAEAFHDYIITRRDLLVPPDVRERKGAFFTPLFWAQKSQECLKNLLGVHFQQEYILWDCAAGTGNLLEGLSNASNLFASTLDKNDVQIIKERKGLALLPDNVFQFDFLNNPLFDTKERGKPKKSKLPESLQAILKDPKQLSKLIIYINPPYAEAGSKSAITGKGKNKDGVAKTTKIAKDYAKELGKATNELFAQFFMRIAKEIAGGIQDKKQAVRGPLLCAFSKLKYLNSSNFKVFREHFKAKFLGGFMCPGNTFDNVKGEFPIGFLCWDLGVPEPIDSVALEIYESSGEFVGVKEFRALDNVPSINEWIAHYTNKKAGFEAWGDVEQSRGDFQHANRINLHNHQRNTHDRPLRINATNLHALSVYFSVQHCFKHTWINDRDQFYAPYNDSWQADTDFLGSCLVFMLFHSQNRLSTAHGANHFIPFKEQEVKARGRYTHHTLLDFLAGKSSNLTQQDKLFKTQQSPTLPTFTPTAQSVLEAGCKLYCYYHNQDNSNPNATLYDIKEFFSGRDSKGKLNPTHKAKDTHYKTLYAALKATLDNLAQELQPQVQEYGFLR